jgi:hypothetical protein
MSEKKAKGSAEVVRQSAKSNGRDIPYFKIVAIPIKSTIELGKGVRSLSFLMMEKNFVGKKITRNAPVSSAAFLLWQARCFYAR